MPQKTPNDQIFTLRLPNALAEEVRDRARETGRPVGNFIRHALRQVLAGRVPLPTQPTTRLED